MLEDLLTNQNLQNVIEHSTLTTSLYNRVDPSIRLFRDDKFLPALEHNNSSVVKSVGYLADTMGKVLYLGLEASLRLIEASSRTIGKIFLSGAKYSANKIKNENVSLESRRNFLKSLGIIAAGSLTYTIVGNDDRTNREELASETPEPRQPRREHVHMPATTIGPRQQIQGRLQNSNGYVLTVNGQNTGILRRLGWLDIRPQDYTIANTSGWQQHFSREFSNYGVLIITGHHQRGSANIYGTASLNLEDLPQSDAVEMVMFSSCNTVLPDLGSLQNVYNNLESRFTNLKTIVGFKRKSLRDDGVIPAIMGKRNVAQKSMDDFVTEAIRINPSRIAVATKDENGWTYHDNRGSANLYSLGRMST